MTKVNRKLHPADRTSNMLSERPKSWARKCRVSHWESVMCVIHLSPRTRKKLGRTSTPRLNGTLGSSGFTFELFRFRLAARSSVLQQHLQHLSRTDIGHGDSYSQSCSFYGMQWYQSTRNNQQYGNTATSLCLQGGSYLSERNNLRFK